MQLKGSIHLAIILFSLRVFAISVLPLIEDPRLISVSPSSSIPPSTSISPSVAIPPWYKPICSEIPTAISPNTSASSTSPNTSASPNEVPHVPCWMIQRPSAIRFRKITYPLGDANYPLSVIEVLDEDLNNHPYDAEFVARQSLLYRGKDMYNNTELFVEFTDAGFHWMTWGRWRAAAAILRDYYEDWEPYGVQFGVWALADPMVLASGEMRLNNGVEIETETKTGLEVETE